MKNRQNMRQKYKAFLVWPKPVYLFAKNFFWLSDDILAYKIWINIMMSHSPPRDPCLGQRVAKYANVYSYWNPRDCWPVELTQQNFLDFQESFLHYYSYDIKIKIDNISECCFSHSSNFIIQDIIKNNSTL